MVIYCHSTLCCLEMAVNYCGKKLYITLAPGDRIWQLIHPDCSTNIQSIFNTKLVARWQNRTICNNLRWQVHTFFFVTDESAKLARVFVPGRPFRPSLMVAIMAGAYPSEVHFRCSTPEQAPGLTYKQPLNTKPLAYLAHQKENKSIVNTAFGVLFKYLVTKFLRQGAPQLEMPHFKCSDRISNKAPLNENDYERFVRRFVNPSLEILTDFFQEKKISKSLLLKEVSLLQLPLFVNAKNFLPSQLGLCQNKLGCLCMKSVLCLV